MKNSKTLSLRKTPAPSKKKAIKKMKAVKMNLRSRAFNKDVLNEYELYK